MKTTILRIIFIILLIIMFFIIFNFSQQDGEKSSSVSRKVTIAVTENVKKIQELEKNRKEIVLQKIEKVIRKLAHFSLYTIIGILSMSLMSTYDTEQKKKISISIIIGLLYAIFDEIHQSFISGRTAMITDVMIDTIGVVFGILLIIFLLKSCRKLKEIVEK